MAYVAERAPMNSFVLKIWILTFLIVGMIPSDGIAQATAESLQTRLDAASDQHPRLFVNDSEWPVVKSRILDDPLLGQAYELLQAHADTLLEEPPVRRIKTGIRLLSVSRECLKRVSYLAMAYRMTEETRYLRRAEKEMLAASAFEDWNPSHYLDVAEMTAALAIGYDWLYNDLPPKSRDTIRQAIVEKGLKTSLIDVRWVTAENNWNQVCHGGMTLGALAVLEEESELAQKVIGRAIKNVPIALAEYEPDGVYPEGSSYWKYGTTYNVILLDALRSVLGTDFGLMEYDGFKKSPYFYLHSSGTTGKFFNFADGSTSAGVSPAMHWFASALNDPTLLWNEQKNLEAFVSRAKPEKMNDRMLMFLLLWGQSMEAVTQPDQTFWSGEGSAPVVFSRSGWGKGETFFGFKAGSPGTNHGHMDIGSFVVDMKGVRWAVDLGSQNYYSLESKGLRIWNRAQNSDRWKVFRINTNGHNTLMIDGQQQKVDGHSSLGTLSADSVAPFAIMNMEPTYTNQIKIATRGMRAKKDWVLIQDEVMALDRPTTVRWGMVTNAQVRIVDDLHAELTQDGQTVLLSVDVFKKSGIALRVIDVERPPMEFDADNPNTRMIAFDIVLDPNEIVMSQVYVHDRSIDVRQLNNVLNSWK
jgi:hypothetical protein